MPFWQRREKANTHDSAYVEQTAHQVKQDLAAGADPRNSIAVDYMLQWLWQLDTAKVSAIHRVLAAPTTDLTDYGRFLYALPVPDEMPKPGQYHSATTAAIRDYLAQCLYCDETPLRQERESLKPDRIDIKNGIMMVARLRMVGAHEIICRLLIAASYLHRKRRDATAIRALDATGQIIKMSADCLLVLPPDEIPYFWSKLILPGADRDLGPVAARMRDRRAVPFMLETLPSLDIDIAANVVVALGNIKDIRAVPALQEIAANKSHPVSYSAAQALAEILHSSRDDAVMLLRATDSRHGGKAAETLLRPAAGVPDATKRSNELLRAADRSPNERKDEV